MSEIEVPIEQTQEHLHHQALHGHSSPNDLINIGALLSAIFAVFAALSALMAGHYSNEAMIHTIKASDQWSFYQAKGVKSAIQELRLNMDNQGANDQKNNSTLEKIARYKTEQEEIKNTAEELEHSSEKYLHWHEKLAMAVTFFQVSIAVIAIGVLTRKKFFFLGGSCSGLIGIIIFISFLLS